MRASATSLSTVATCYTWYGPRRRCTESNNLSVVVHCRNCNAIVIHVPVCPNGRYSHRYSLEGSSGADSGYQSTACGNLLQLVRSAPSLCRNRQLVSVSSLLS